MKKKVFYQPEFDDNGFIKGHPKEYIHSFEVWKKKKNLLKVYPKCTPLPYEVGEIEEPTFMD